MSGSIRSSSSKRMNGGCGGSSNSSRNCLHRRHPCRRRSRRRHRHSRSKSGSGASGCRRHRNIRWPNATRPDKWEETPRPSLRRCSKGLHARRYNRSAAEAVAAAAAAAAAGAAAGAAVTTAIAAAAAAAATAAAEPEAAAVPAAVVVTATSDGLMPRRRADGKRNPRPSLWLSLIHI